MRQPLTVLSVAYPLAPVGPDAVGGAEQVLSAIDRGLVAAGVQSIVIAQEGSSVAGTLVAIPACRGRIDDLARACAQAAVRVALQKHLGAADVVHMHGIDFADYLPPPGPPTVVTLHLPPSWYGALATTRRDTFLHCVSRSQHNSCVPGTGLLPPIANGVDVKALGALSVPKQGYAVILGRICPEKGQHLAIEAARGAGVPLVIAGATYAYPEHEAYFAQRVRPMLDEDRRWIGPIGFTEKRNLLAAARCLLVPSLAPETSSLVAMEALACGTPVIAFRIGALPEIVKHGVTGFIVDDAAEMTEAIEHVGSLEAETCRAHARAHFSQDRMLADYFALYDRLASVRA